MQTQLLRGAAVLITGIQLNALANGVSAPGPERSSATNTTPWNQVGAAAGAQYVGEGLKITPSEHGARLDCNSQRLRVDSN